MIKIFVEIDDQEIEAVFNRDARGNDVVWYADLPVPDEYISISETDGNLDESAMLLSLGVSTPRIVVFERFSIEYKKFIEERIAGFESTEDANGVSGELQPYNPDDIKVRREGFSVFEINRMMTEQNDIDLNPNFQRNLVWDNSRKSALIESILLGIPIPVFYFAESKSGRYHVVDGLQRLSTIKQFFNNEFPLKKLEHLKDDCNGRFYKENSLNKKTIDNSLDRKYTRRLENAQLFVNVIESASPQKVKYDIFKRINTGGRPLNNQEIRNCIANDSIRGFLKSCSSSDEFEKATGNSINDTRMDAQELVLRFTGFVLEREGEVVYNGDMNSFLDSVLDIINDFGPNKISLLKLSFLKALRINYHLFGKYCFRKCLPDDLLPNARKQSINKALFISWMIETLELDEQRVLKMPFESFSAKLAEALKGNIKYYTILTTGTSDKQNLKEASLYAKELISKSMIDA